MTAIPTNRRSFLKIAGTTFLGMVSLASVGWIYSTKIEPGWIEITTPAVTLPHLDPAFDNYRIVQISDIHMETWMNREKLAEIITKVNLQQADLIVITGDFVSEIYENTPDDLIDNLSQLHAPDGVLAVLGNHDYWTNVNVVHQILRASGIDLLANTVQTLQRGDASLHIAGVDDYWEKYANLPKVIEQLPADGAAILLAHEPDFADISAATGRFDLQLSGHSHGGQIIPPGFRPIILPPFSTKYPIGSYQVDNMLLYTNRGLGTADLQIRFNCRPEIAVITLHSGTTPK